MEINFKFIEQYIYDKYLKGIVSISKEQEKYVMEDDILKLKLTDDEKKYVRKILFDRDIDIRQEPITKKDRSPLVRNNTYGTVKYTDYSKNDKPVYAVLEYDKIGNLIYSDYSKLDEYLDTYIKDNYRFKKINEDNYEVSIALHKLLKLKLCEKEYEHVFEYLNERNIIVRGYSPNFDSEFINFNYLRTFSNIPFPEKIIGYDVEKNIELYHKNKDIKLRNEIAEQTMRLVPFIAYNYSMLFNIDINVLNSYGYEELIKSIERFDTSKNVKFSSYAVKCIKGAIINGIRHEKSNSLAVGNSEMLSKFYNAKKLYCDDNGLYLSEVDDIEYLDEILEFMYMLGLVDEWNIDNIKYMILYNNFISIDENLQEDESGITMDDEDDEFEMNNLSYNNNEEMEEEVLKKLLAENVDDVLSTLNPREQKVLRLRFGLDDGRSRTLEEVGQVFNVTRERIRQVEARAFRKLRHPSRYNKLKGWVR